MGEDDRAVELQIETSNFGATIELDQNVYTWTDKVFITAVASDYNFDSNVIDEIGPENDGEITIRVRGDGLKEYKLAETGPDTGVFTGEITLAGFTYDRIDYIRANVQPAAADRQTARSLTRTTRTDSVSHSSTPIRKPHLWPLR